MCTRGRSAFCNSYSVCDFTCGTSWRDWLSTNTLHSTSTFENFTVVQCTRYQLQADGVGMTNLPCNQDMCKKKNRYYTPSIPDVVQIDYLCATPAPALPLGTTRWCEVARSCPVEGTKSALTVWFTWSSLLLNRSRLPVRTLPTSG